MLIFGFLVTAQECCIFKRGAVGTLFTKCLNELTPVGLGCIII